MPLKARMDSAMALGSVLAEHGGGTGVAMEIARAIDPALGAPAKK